jgi:hypothetical protein
MILRRVAIAFLCLTSCNTIGSPRPVSYDESTVSQPGNPLGDGSSVPGTAEIDAINSVPGIAGTDPTAEHVVSCAALIAGAIFLTGLIIVVYKVGKILHH